MGIEIGGQIERVNGKELSYREFEEKYMARNWPVVLTGLMEDWRACTDWVTENGKPNFQFLVTNFGRSKVQVAECGTREFTDQKRVEMSVSEFIGRWLESSMQPSSSSDGVARDKSVLYLKDWHFVKEYPEYMAYTTPQFFCDDWLNLYLDNYRLHNDPNAYSENNEVSCSDYRFVYMGEKGSWTPLHPDVFRSYSWSANVCGKKRWLLLSPDQKHLVFDRNMKNCIYNIFDDVNKTTFPAFKEAIWLECIQEPNEIIFVPSGWYHQVHNLEDTISINHNWFNCHNLDWVWDLLLKDYKEAKKCIEDIKDICDDFEDLCQRNLAANTGMNFKDFFIFLARINLCDLVRVSHLLRENVNIMYLVSPIISHLILNLGSIRRVANGMKSLVVSNFNIMETLDDPRFHNLLMVSEQTYGKIFNQQILDYHSNRSPMCDFRERHIRTRSSSLITTPEDLLEFVNHVMFCNVPKKFRTVDIKIDVKSLGF